MINLNDTPTLDAMAPTFDRILGEVHDTPDDQLDRVVRATSDLRVAQVDLRRALAELGDDAGADWAQYARAADAALVDLEIELTVAAATLKAVGADTREELHGALAALLASVKGRMDEVRVRAHVGQLNLHDAADERTEAVDAASRRIAQIVGRVEHEAGASLGELRTTAAEGIGELRRSVLALLDAVLPAHEPTEEGGTP